MIDINRLNDEGAEKLSARVWTLTSPTGRWHCCLVSDKALSLDWLRGRFGRDWVYSILFDSEADVGKRKLMRLVEAQKAAEAKQEAGDSDD